MPLYEYLCDACGSQFEVIRRFSDPPLEACTSCGGSVKKLLSSPAIQFKGSGWYVTDYARKGSTGGGSSSTADGAPSASGETKSGDTKTGDTKTGDAKAGDAKAGDAKAGDTPGKSPKTDA